VIGPELRILLLVVLEPAQSELPIQEVSLYVLPSLFLFTQAFLLTDWQNATWSINYIKIYNKTVINTAYLNAGAEPNLTISMIGLGVWTLGWMLLALVGRNW
jgi:hypothetical protein